MKKTRTERFFESAAGAPDECAEKIQNQILQERGDYWRIKKHILTNPATKTVGIFTAWNPGRNLALDVNTERNKELMRDLRAANYGPIRIRELFGKFERSLIVPNMTREDVVKFGKRFEQESVIWGYKKKDHNGGKITWYYINGDKVTQKREVTLWGDENPDLADAKDLYSQERQTRRGQAVDGKRGPDKGKKFLIPFYDVDYEVKIDKPEISDRDLQESIWFNFCELGERDLAPFAPFLERKIYEKLERAQHEGTWRDYGNAHVAMYEILHYVRKEPNNVVLWFLDESFDIDENEIPQRIKNEVNEIRQLKSKNK